MRLRATGLLTGGAAAVSIALPGAAAACQKPVGMHFDRKPGRATGSLSWKRPRRGHFRVYRNHRVVGQTLGHAIRVAVKPGRRYVFLVRPMTGSGAVGSCSARLKQKMRYQRRVVGDSSGPCS